MYYLHDEVDMDELSFEEWIEFVFNHEISEPRYSWYYDDYKYIYGSSEKFAENCIKLFNNPEFLLERFTVEQLDQGFFGFILGPGSYNHLRLWDKENDVALRREFIMSSVKVFEKLFTKNPLIHACFMWWDSLIYFDDDGDERVKDWMFEALSQILKIDSLDCQMSALHGLGHLEHNGKKDLINSFLTNNPDFPDKEYAFEAIEGKVL